MTSVRWGLSARWIAVVALPLVFGPAAFVGFGLINSVSRAPAAVHRAFEVQAVATVTLGLVANLESDRRGYELTEMREHFAAMELDHERIHEALRGLRKAVTPSPVLLARVDSVEAAVGSWADEFAVREGASPSARANVAKDRRLLGRARRQLESIIAATEREKEVAEAAVLAARTKARALWLGVTGVTVLAIVGLAEVAHRRQVRVKRTAHELELLLDALPFALLSLDRNGRIRHAAGRTRTTFGTQNRALVGCRLQNLVRPWDRAEFEAAIVRALSGTRAECEAQIQGDGAAPRVLAFTFTPIGAASGAVGLSVVAHDITAERALKLEALQSGRLASVGSVVAGVVRELATPLAAIRKSAASVDVGKLEPQQLAALVAIAAEASRAARIVARLVAFSHHHAHRHESINLASVVEDAVRLRRYDPRSRDVDYEVDVETGLPAVLGDAQELQQVVLNLLLNAEDAVRDQPERSIVVRVRRGPGAKVLVSVEDSGLGIPEDRLQVIFEPFYTTKPRGEGVGLGLALARGVVAEHHGAIRAEPGANGGARLVIELPALANADGGGGGGCKPGAGDPRLTAQTRQPTESALVHRLRRRTPPERRTTMKVTDPVCGMQIEQEKAAATAEYRGVRYWFCSEACRQRFEQDPAKYGWQA